MNTASANIYISIYIYIHMSNKKWRREINQVDDIVYVVAVIT